MKKVELPELNHYDYERNYKNFNKEMFPKFFEIFFSAEFNAEIIKKIMVAFLPYAILFLFILLTLNIWIKFLIF